MQANKLTGQAIDTTTELSRFEGKGVSAIEYANRLVVLNAHGESVANLTHYRGPIFANPHLRAVITESQQGTEVLSLSNGLALSKTHDALL